MYQLLHSVEANQQGNNSENKCLIFESSFMKTLFSTAVEDLLSLEVSILKLYQMMVHLYNIVISSKQVLEFLKMNQDTFSNILTVFHEMTVLVTDIRERWPFFVFLC